MICGMLSLKKFKNSVHMWPPTEQPVLWYSNFRCSQADISIYFCNYCKKLYCLQCSINKVPYIIRNELEVITKYLLLESVTIFQCAKCVRWWIFPLWHEFENYVLHFQFTNSHFHLHIIVEMKALYCASVSQNHLNLMFSIPKCL
jgi:hypothetical protein